MSIAKILTQLNPVLGIVDGIVDHFVPDKTEAAKAKSELRSKIVDNQHEINKAQIAVNVQEAKHKSIFVAGWRPAVGWICAFSLLWHFVLVRMIAWGALIAGVKIPAPPELDVGPLMTLLLGMLGIAGMRSFDKKQGTASRRVRE